MKKRLHRKSSADPFECPQGLGETWRYFYRGEYLVLVTVDEAQDLHDEDGWRCLVLLGGAWKYPPGAVLDWAIRRHDDGGWEKVE